MASPLVLPPSKYVDSLHGTVTRHVRRVEIYESDNQTLWRSSEEVGLLGGEVQVDSGRDERRTFDLELDNSDHDLLIGADHLWYDKIVKMYRGVRHADGSTWETKIGEFMIDSIDDQNFPNSISLSGRDMTKRLMLDKFATTTGFPKNQPVEELIRVIAINGGIPTAKMNLQNTGKSTTKDYYFDRTMARWEAIKKITTDAALEIYFDKEGVLQLEVFADPYGNLPEYTFQTGVNSNVGEFSKSLADDRIYNHVVVTGGSDDPDILPPYAVASNTAAGSPTSIAKLGRRSYFYTSSFMTTTAQCQDVADKFLKIHALEQYNVDISALVVPYLEAGITVEFFDPQPDPDAPTQYLLSGFTIPMSLDPMSTNLKRLVQVG